MLLQACWSYFDHVAERVSPELRKGPRGGGRNRDEIVNHSRYTEIDQMAVKIGVRSEWDIVKTLEGRAAHREDYLDAFRAYNAEGKSARTWSLPFLLRHTCYLLMDHAWEMEDKDLTGESDV